MILLWWIIMWVVMAAVIPLDESSPWVEVAFSLTLLNIVLEYWRRRDARMVEALRNIPEYIPPDELENETESDSDDSGF